jgi:ABC-type Fe3+ transport system substrate-binding protein
MRRLTSLLLFSPSIFLAFTLLQAQTAPVDRAKLIEEAKKEGKVVVYAAYSASDANTFKSAFEKKYPFIKFEYFRAGKDKLLARYLTEAKAGQFFPDVYQSSIFPVMTLLQRGLLGKYVSPERGAFPDALKDKEGYWTAVYLNAMTIAYNTRMVKPDEVPKSYPDLLLPKWKGKMGMDLNKTEWYVAMLQLMGEEKGKKYMEALSKQDIQARDGNTLTGQLLVAGEFPLVVSQYPTSVEEYKKLKAPIEWVPLEPHFVYSIVMAPTAKQPHPAAGKLFIDFVLSEEGQKLMRSLSRIPARKDVLPDPPHLIQGHKLLVLNPASSEDYNRYNNEYHKYFR